MPPRVTASSSACQLGHSKEELSARVNFLPGGWIWLPLTWSAPLKGSFTSNSLSPSASSAPDLTSFPLRTTVLVLSKWIWTAVVESSYSGELNMEAPFEGSCICQKNLNSPVLFKSKIPSEKKTAGAPGNIIFPRTAAPAVSILFRPGRNFGNLTTTSGTFSANDKRPKSAEA